MSSFPMLFSLPPLGAAHTDASGKRPPFSPEFLPLQVVDGLWLCYGPWSRVGAHDACTVIRTTSLPCCRPAILAVTTGTSCPSQGH
jgi:hypothetical protein